MDALDQMVKTFPFSDEHLKTPCHVQWLLKVLAAAEHAERAKVKEERREFEQDLDQTMSQNVQLQSALAEVQEVLSTPNAASVITICEAFEVEALCDTAVQQELSHANLQISHLMKTLRSLEKQVQTADMARDAKCQQVNALLVALEAQKAENAGQLLQIARQCDSLRAEVTSRHRYLENITEILAQANHSASQARAESDDAVARAQQAARAIETRSAAALEEMMFLKDEVKTKDLQVSNLLKTLEDEKQQQIKTNSEVDTLRAAHIQSYQQLQLHEDTLQAENHQLRAQLQTLQQQVLEGKHLQLRKEEVDWQTELKAAQDRAQEVCCQLAQKEQQVMELLVALEREEGKTAMQQNEIKVQQEEATRRIAEVEKKCDSLTEHRSAMEQKYARSEDELLVCKTDARKALGDVSRLEKEVEHHSANAQQLQQELRTEMDLRHAAERAMSTLQRESRDVADALRNEVETEMARCIKETKEEALWAEKERQRMAAALAKVTSEMREAEAARVTLALAAAGAVAKRTEDIQIRDKEGIPIKMPSRARKYNIDKHSSSTTMAVKDEMLKVNSENIAAHNPVQSSVDNSIQDVSSWRHTDGRRVLRQQQQSQCSRGGTAKSRMLSKLKGSRPSAKCEEEQVDKMNDAAPAVNSMQHEQVDSAEHDIICDDRNLGLVNLQTNPRSSQSNETKTMNEQQGYSLLHRPSHMDLKTEVHKGNWDLNADQV